MRGRCGTQPPPLSDCLLSAVYNSLLSCIFVGTSALKTRMLLPVLLSLGSSNDIVDRDQFTREKGVWERVPAGRRVCLALIPTPIQAARQDLNPPS